MLPHYYSSLSPFRETFRRGLPILTYHKLGPRPTNARLKGLYLSRRLFERQMAELKNADFQAARLSDAAKPVSGATGRIVITFDDGFRKGVGADYWYIPSFHFQWATAQYTVSHL